MAVTRLSLNGASAAPYGAFSAKTAKAVAARKRRSDPGWLPLIFETGTRFGAWLFLLYWALRA